ncbi:hypothetical protein ACWD48_10680 [Streptomyces sp. NPDC002519]
MDALVVQPVELDSAASPHRHRARKAGNRHGRATLHRLQAPCRRP